MSLTASATLIERKRSQEMDVNEAGEATNLSLERLARIRVFAYGAKTRTVSVPRDLGLTPVTRTGGQVRKLNSDSSLEQ